LDSNLMKISIPEFSPCACGSKAKLLLSERGFQIL
jgi:hypothetical protein